MARRRRRKSSSNDIQAKRRTSSAASNFLAVLMGMATSIAVGLWSWHMITTQANAESTADRQETTRSTVLDAQGNVVQQNYNEFESLLNSDDVTKMSSELLQLNNWPRDADLPIRISSNRKRIRLARRLLEIKNIPEEDRALAGDSLIDGIAAIYGLDLFHSLGDKNIAKEMKEAAESYADDSNPKLLRAAKLALLKYHTFEYIKYRQPEQIPMVENVLMETMNAYSNDAYGLSNVKLIFKSLSRLDPKLAVNLTQLVRKQRKRFVGTRAERLIADLTDSDLLIQSQYLQLYENRWVNGKAGQQQLLDVSAKLAGSTEAGVSLIQEVDRVAQWFEQANRYDSARKVYEIMAKNAARPDNPEATELAKRLGQNGLTRCDAIGKTMRFSGTDINGEPIISNRFRDKIVMIIFWSSRDSRSSAELTSLHRERTRYGSLPIATIAVCLDKSRSEAFSDTVKRLPRFVCSDPEGNTDGNVPFLDQCPVSRVPQIVLVDHTGKIVDTNVPADHLQSHLENLATKR